MGLTAAAIRVQAAAKRVWVKQSHAVAIVAGAVAVVSGVAEWSEPLARILAGLLVIVFFGIEFGRTR
jgi:hypothetical protein